jgi:hypothetical protein
LQLFPQGGQALGGQSRGFKVDVRRIDLDRRHIQHTPRHRGQNFLGNANPVGEKNTDAHGV